jgi:hypothetical protein
MHTAQATGKGLGVKVVARVLTSCFVVLLEDALLIMFKIIQAAPADKPPVRVQGVQGGARVLAGFVGGQMIHAGPADKPLVRV